MFDSIVAIIHNATTLLFGVYIAAAFTGIRMNRKNILTLFGFSSVVGVIYALSFIFLKDVITAQIYPLIIHLPLIVFLILYYKNKVLPSVLSVLTAYLCCQISKWIGLVALELTGHEWVYYSTRIIVTVLTFIVLILYVSDAAAQLMRKPSKALLIFTLMPFTYYLFDYITGVFTALIYSGKEVIVEFLGFALCIGYLLFLLVYFSEYEKKREAEQQTRMLEMQQSQSKKEIEAMKRSEYSVSLLRHDMRHFLLNISALIDNGEYGKANEYINGIINLTDKTITRRYCKNEIVNTILSSYENRFKDNSVDFQYSVQIPEKLSVSDIDLTSILSNAIENAINAVLPLEPEKRHISLDLHMNDNKLLISVKNSFAVKPNMVDGMPQSKTDGHGFGTQSIRYVTEKMNGNCQFYVEGDWFYLRVII